MTQVEVQSHVGTERWYSGTTPYQWLVLLIASLGWIFDTFEGQIFVASMREAMPSLVPADTEPGDIQYYNNIALASFLAGGALGGVFFGILSDRIGRKRTMSFTILFYSLFTGLSAFSQTWWQLAGLRFLVALGVGGEWAVASSMVAEVFPTKARAYVGSIFHASSILGGYLALAAGAFLIGSKDIHDWATGGALDWVSPYVEPSSVPWRLGFGLGVLPALLIIWIRSSLREPETWVESKVESAHDNRQRMGSLVDLFRGKMLRRTLVGLTLATSGLATYWGTHIYGKNTLEDAAARSILADVGAENATPERKKEVLAEHVHDTKQWEMLGMFLVSTGGGLGLLAFGPICARIGRRPAFLFYYLGGMAIALVCFLVLTSVTAVMIALPIFGFLTLGMHAGYAVYFPELYPTRLRGTGAGFCFNAARLLAAPMLFANGWVQSEYKISLLDSASLMSLLYLIGVAALAFAPETKGRELPA